MRKPDFSGIEPARVPEARRRLKAIEDYLAITSPTGDDIIRHANSIGLSRYQFGHLTRVWKLHRDARMLVIGKRGKSKRDYGIDPVAKTIAQMAFAELPADTTIADAERRVREQCVKAGVKPPCRATVYNWMAAREAHTIEEGVQLEVRIGRMWPKLIVRGNEDNYPQILAAVAIPEKLILSYEVSFDPWWPPSIAKVVTRLLAQQNVGATPRPLFLSANDLQSSSDILKAAGVVTHTHRSSNLRALKKCIGTSLSNLPVIWQPGRARKKPMDILSRQDEALSEADALNAIEHAVNRHNARFHMTDFAFDLSKG